MEKWQGGCNGACKTQQVESGGLWWRWVVVVAATAELVTLSVRREIGNGRGG